MATKNEENWMMHYNELKAYTQERGHLPDKHVVTNRSLLSWAKYQRKKIKEGTCQRCKDFYSRNWRQVGRRSILVGEGKKFNKESVNQINQHTMCLHYGLRDKNGKWCNPKVLLDVIAAPLLIFTVARNDHFFEGQKPQKSTLLYPLPTRQFLF